MNTHLHITSWVLALILLIVVVVLHNQGKEKGAKITHMILRLVYLVILGSGGHLLGMYFSGPNVALALVKSVAGLWVIASMEMVAVKTVKNKPAGGMWIQFAIAFIITLILGFVVL